MKRRRTTEEFIKQAKEVHGDKYDYSKVEYLNEREKVEIICSLHGSFLQEPRHHLNGCKCPKCSNVNKPTNEEFIKKARNVHGNKYEYSKINYINAHTKICIICPIHGEFLQTPNDHLNGKGCPKCCGGGVKFTKEEFIQKAKEIHGDKYDYSKIEYVNIKTKVCIICPIHGEFWQTPEKHLIGRGCHSCSKTKKLTTKEFIKKAKGIHGNEYDYSKSEYVNRDTKISIKCNKCGREFSMTPHNHLIHKEGCPYCKTSKLEKDVENLLVKNDVQYDKQKVFKWFINGKSIKKADFYLPKEKLVIECQGLQHFKSVEYFGGKESFNKRIELDELKKRLCEEHGIKVLYYSDLDIVYPYKVITNKDELLEEIKKAAKSQD